MGTKLDKVFYDQIVTISGSDVHWSISFVVSLLLIIFTLSNHHADHVQIAIFAGFPNVFKSLLNFVVFADYESRLLLSIFHGNKSIKICFPFE